MFRSRRFARVIALPIALTLVVAACGSDDEDATEGSGAPAATTEATDESPGTTAGSDSAATTAGEASGELETVTL